jgi:hypothetical protein
MKTVSFSSLRSILSLAFAMIAFAFASTAAAQTTTTCNGCTNTNPATFGLSVTGVSGFSGNGATVFNGTSGFGKVIKDGSATMNITLGMTGNGCANNSCGNSTFTVKGTAAERVRAMGGARSNTAGVQADVANAGTAAASIGVIVNLNPAAGQ